MEGLNNTSPFRYGVFTMLLCEWTIPLLFEFKLNRLFYMHDSRAVNAYSRAMDYSTWMSNDSPAFSFFSVLPG
jgi:hypothetical protein